MQPIAVDARRLIVWLGTIDSAYCNRLYCEPSAKIDNVRSVKVMATPGVD